MSGIKRLSHPRTEDASTTVVTKLIKIVTKKISIQSCLRGITNENVTKIQLIKKQVEPIIVLVSEKILNFPLGHFLPVKAAMGSHTAKINIGR